ncbi:hypothetical protein TNCV_3545751 [Trichonephila clavipes]|nr:hypothetical protein TNCV_3545751 [Trichonephila clavipes]
MPKRKSFLTDSDVYCSQLFELSCHLETPGARQSNIYEGKGSFWVPSVPNECESTLPIMPKRSSSRHVGTSSYRYHTATYSHASVLANE